MRVLGALVILGSIALAGCGSAALDMTPSPRVPSPPVVATPEMSAAPATPEPITPSPPPAACVESIAAAAAIDDNSDQVTDLDPAIRACPSLEVFAAVAAQYPTALDGVDAAVFVGNRCDDATAGLTDTAICGALPH